MLYAFSQVAVQQRFDSHATWETFKSTMRSSFFIFFHAYQGSMMGCALRRGFGRFYYRVLVCAPALLSSYLSLLIEKPSRRQALAFYLLNMASEIVYRMLVTKGYFTPIRHGETLLFAASLGAWYHLLKAHGFGHDPVSAAVKVLIGRDEAKSKARRRKAPDETHQLAAIKDDCEHKLSGTTTPPTPPQQQPKQHKHNDLLAKLSRLGDQLVDSIEQFATRWLGGRHGCCPHAERSCFYYTIRPIPSRFLLGFLIQTTLKSTSNPINLFREPAGTIKAAMASPGSIKFGLFLVTLVSSGRLASCLLRRHSNSNEPAWHGLVSGFVAGLSMFWAPRSSLSMYIMWKAVEQYYLLAASQGRVPYFNFQISTIYSISAATILYTFALEPKFVRPSYMKFLDNMSNHRLHQLNRMVLDVFGTGSSVGYEDYFPDLDPKFMSNQFKELIFNWMIQPYE